LESSKLGLILMVIGLGMLLSSFAVAYLAYASAETIKVSAESMIDVFTQLIAVIVEILPKLVWIALMVAIGGMVLSKGVSLVKVRSKK